MTDTSTIFGLTFDTKADGWDRSQGFIKREVAMPQLDEAAQAEDALSVLLEIQYAGMCGTDRGIWQRQVFKELIHSSLAAEGKTQRILGHEFVGKVVKAGSLVGTLYGLREGDAVSGDSHVTCGRCFQCRVGEEEVCQDQKILGISTDGIFARYVKVPAKNLWAVDFARVRPEIAAMLDPFGNAVHACSKVDLRGKRVAILGCGPIGMFAVLLARAFGAVKVIAVDVLDANLAMARELGAHVTVKLDGGAAAVGAGSAAVPADPKLRAEIMKLTYNKGVDVAFEMAGPNASVVNAIEVTRSGGHVILFGLKDGDFALPAFKSIVVRGLTLHGIIGRQLFQTWQTSQRMLSDPTNGIQDKIWRIMLNEGHDTIVPFADYEPASFLKIM